MHSDRPEPHNCRPHTPSQEAARDFYSPGKGNKDEEEEIPVDTGTVRARRGWRVQEL